MTTKTRALGQWAEQQALIFLQQGGYVLVEQNYHSRYGEIDLIVRKNQELVFVEVKARSAGNWAQAHEVISFSKQRKIIQTAQHYLAQSPHFQDCYCRFDALCFELSQPVAKTIQQDFYNLIYDLQWIENAFTLDQ